MRLKASIEGTKGWSIISIFGTLYETQGEVLEIIEKGDTDTAKVTEGSDAKGNKITFVVIKNYKT